MKRFTTSMLLLALIASLGLIGCSKDDNPTASTNNNPPAAQIPAEAVDVWVYSGATVNGTSVSLSSVLDWTGGAVVATFEIEADGSFYYFEFDASYNTLYWRMGTVTISGNRLTVTTTHEEGVPVTPHSYSGTWQVVGSTMTQSLTLNGDSIRLTAVK